MGCSVVTIIEFIVFGIHALYLCVKYKTRPSNSSQTNRKQNGESHA